MTAPHAEEAFRLYVRTALGYAPRAIEPGRLQRFATNERRGDSAGWCLMFPDRAGGAYGCHRSGLQGTWAAADEAALTPGDRAERARQLAAAAHQRRAQEQERHATNRARNDALWAECQPVSSGDPVVQYLERRGLDRSELVPEVLRYHAALPYWHNGQCLGRFPAMVAPLVSADGHLVALHRTFLTADGRKADLPNAKKLTGAAGQLAGSCIRLFQADGDCAGIAEGIETALAAHRMSSVPTVAAYCASNLAAWQWPTYVRRLVVFADADEAGRRAAEALSSRARSAGLRVDVLMPTDAGADWCDVWAACNIAAGDAEELA